MHWVDRGECFQMSIVSILLQNLASIPPRTSPLKFRRRAVRDSAEAEKRRRAGSAAACTAATSGPFFASWKNCTGLVLGCIERNFASKNAFESSSRDLHNALLCTALKSHFFQKIARILSKFAKIFRNFARFAEFCKISKNLN